MAKILVVEDDPTYAAVVRDWLRSQHHDVEVVHEGNEAMARLKSYSFDVVILDWKLPGITGIEICKQFRAGGGQTPILMLTGKDRLDETETGLDSGADDYLSKTAHLRELAVRVRALLRRTGSITENVLKVRHVVLDPGTHTVTSNGEPVPLLPREFALLEFLMRHVNRVFSADELLERVWSTDSEATPHAVRACINRVRGKLENCGESIIRTVYSVGYKVED